MKPVHQPSFRSATFTATIVSLTIVGLSTGCGESGTSANAGISSPATPGVPLDVAIMRGDDEAVYAHIVVGTSVNTKSMTGDTPLHVAAALGRTYAAEVLIGAGAELETINASGVTPLFNAAFFGHTDVLQSLIEAGANTKTVDQTGTPIMEIVEIPWDQIRPIYEMVHSSIGLPFDEQRIKNARPRVAELLR